MNNRAKRIKNTRALVLKQFDNECIIHNCGSVLIMTLIDSHIYPRGAYPEISDVIYNRVPLCPYHDQQIEYTNGQNSARKTPAERIRYLFENISKYHEPKFRKNMRILHQVMEAKTMSKALFEFSKVEL